MTGGYSAQVVVHGPMRRTKLGAERGEADREANSTIKRSGILAPCGLHLKADLAFIFGHNASVDGVRRWWCSEEWADSGTRDFE